MIRVAINGFGRIGRTTARLLLNHEKIQLVAVNDLADIHVLSYLLRYDSIHGKWPQEVIADEAQSLIRTGRNEIHFSRISDPGQLPWKKLGIDIVLECTGHFKTKAAAGLHLEAGAKKVIISAPADDADIKTIVLGVNDHLIADDRILSNASCTTNSAAPLIQLLDECCGIESGYITTIHSYTTDQRLHDSPHKDFRRARAGAISIVPTTTGAAKALTRIFPTLEGKLGGCGIRVPVPDGSLTDLTCIVSRPQPAEAINSLFQKAAEGRWKGILEYCSDPIVSVDIINNPSSCIYDSQLTSVIGKMVKVVGWYDNESGYSNRLVDLVLKVAGNN